MAHKNYKGKRCGDHGGINSFGKPCGRREFWGYGSIIPSEQTKLSGRCKEHQGESWRKNSSALVPNDQERKFIDAYCGPARFNKAKAARMAGHAIKHAGQQGHQIYNRPRVLAAIQARLDEYSMSAAEVTKRLTDWGRGDFTPFLTITAGGQVYLDLSSEEAQRSLYLIKKLKQTEHIVEGDGDEVILRRVFEITLHDAKDAVIQMAKIHGLFTDGPTLNLHFDKNMGDAELIETLRERQRRLAELLERESPTDTGEIIIEKE